MTPPTLKAQKAWLSVAKVQELVQLEPALVILGLSVAAWVVYKVFLGEVSAERHRNLRAHFRNLFGHALLAIFLLGAYFLVASQLTPETPAGAPVERLTAYIGVLALLAGLVVFVRLARILVFEWLFLGHMRVAVPLLLVNLSTLLLTIVLGAWVLSEVFEVRLAPLLATSAILSIVLGLALQDTLGNLFAGVAMQFDKPYEIGDWVEIHANGQKWVGQIHEISWRATVLIGLSDETITIPNRVIGQSEISNFAPKGRPIYRRQTFLLPHGAPLERARQALLKVVHDHPGIRREPAPLVLITEAGDSWVTLRLVYTLDNYGAQWVIADQVFGRALERLEREGIRLASPRMMVLRPDDGTAAAS